MNKDLIVGKLETISLLPSQTVSAGTTNGTGVDMTRYGGNAVVLADSSIVVKSSDLLGGIGAFTDAAYWSKGPGWSIAGNKATCDGSQTGQSKLSNCGSGYNGAEAILFTVSDYTAGNIIGNLGTFSGDGVKVDFVDPMSKPYANIVADADFTGSVSGFYAYSYASSFTDDFAAVGTWVRGTGWTIAGGVASCDGSQTDYSDLAEATASIGLTKSSTRFVYISYTITACSAGSIQTLALGTTGTARTAPGTYTEIIDCGPPTAPGSTVGFRADADFVGTIDNVTIQWFSSTAKTTNVDNTFATATYWNRGDGWVVALNVATRTNIGAISDLGVSTAVVPGATYEVIYTITRTSGSITPMIGGTAGTTRTSAGTYTEHIVAGAGTGPYTIGMRASADFAGTVDSWTVKTGAAVITLQESDDNSTYTTVPDGTFAPSSYAAGALSKKTIHLDSRKKYLRVSATVSGTASTANLACHVLALQEY